MSKNFPILGGQITKKNVRSLRTLGDKAGERFGEEDSGVPRRPAVYHVLCASFIDGGTVWECNQHAGYRSQRECLDEVLDLNDGRSRSCCCFDVWLLSFAFVWRDRRKTERIQKLAALYVSLITAIANAHLIITFFLVFLTCVVLSKHFPLVGFVLSSME